MASVPTSLLIEFAEEISTPPEKKEVHIYGTASIGENDEILVTLDGSDLSTPALSTIEVKDGDRVVVMIKNHTAVITGNLTDKAVSKDIVGGTIRTLPGILRVFELGLDGTVEFDSNVSNFIYSRLMKDGVQSIEKESGTVRGQILHGKINYINAGQTESMFGWYITQCLIARRLFLANGSTDSGEVISGNKVRSMLETTYSLATGVTGIDGVVCGRMATLFFKNFSFDPSLLQLKTVNPAYIPELRLDLKDTLNDVRFYIYSSDDNSAETPAGGIKPTTNLTSSTALRGTFTYIRSNTITS